MSLRPERWCSRWRRSRQVFQANPKGLQREEPEQPRRNMRSDLGRRLRMPADARFLARRRRTPRCAIGCTGDCRSMYSIRRFAFGKSVRAVCLAFIVDRRIFRLATQASSFCRSFPRNCRAYIKIVETGSPPRNLSTPTCTGPMTFSQILRSVRSRWRKKGKCNPFASNQPKISLCNATSSAG